MPAMSLRPHVRPQARTSRHTPGPRPARRGFTLIETSLATVIIGLGVVAIMSAQQAFHQQNRWSTHASIATRLGNEIRELSLSLPRYDPVTDTETWGPEINEVSLDDYDDLDDFDGNGGGLIFSADFNPPNGPINSSRQIITNMAGWSQTVMVFNAWPDDIRFDPADYVGSVAADQATGLILVVVEVRFRGDLMTTVSWIAPN